MKNKFFATATLTIFIFCTNIKSEIINRNYSLIRRYAKSNIAFINYVDLNKLEEVTKLIKNGTDINAIDKNGETALLKAIANKNFEITRLLLKNDADPNKYGTAPFYDIGHTPLAVAVGSNNVEITKILLDTGAQPDKCFFSPFFICSRITPQIFYETLSHRTNYYLKDQEYYEKLFCDISTAACKTKEILHLLIDHGNDFDAFEGLILEEEFESTIGKYQNASEVTPLMLFIKGKNRVLSYLFSMIEHLEKSKKVADLQKIINFTNQIKLTLNQEIDIVSKSCSHIDTKNRFGQSALTIAFEHMDTETIKTLICNGANIETKLSIDKKTLLMSLAKKEYLEEQELELAKFLIKRRAHIEIDYDENIFEPTYKNIKNEKIRKFLIQHKNEQQIKEKKLTIYEINTTINKENLNKFIIKYSTNHYSENDSSKCDNFEEYLCKYDMPGECGLCEGCKKNYLAKDARFPEPKMGI